MPHSSIPKCKTKVLQMIAERPFLDTVQQEWAYPGPDKIEKEAIFLADTEELHEEPAGIRSSNRANYETYTLPIWVSVLQPGDDAQACELRMWEIVAEIEEAIRADEGIKDPDPEPGPVGARILWGTVTNVEPRNFIEADGRVSECKISLGVMARV